MLFVSAVLRRVLGAQNVGQQEDAKVGHRKCSYFVVDPDCD